MAYFRTVNGEWRVANRTDGRTESLVNAKSLMQIYDGLDYGGDGRITQPIYIMYMCIGAGSSSSCRSWQTVDG